MSYRKAHTVAAASLALAVPALGMIPIRAPIAVICGGLACALGFIVLAADESTANLYDRKIAIGGIAGGGIAALFALIVVVFGINLTDRSQDAVLEKAFGSDERDRGHDVIDGRGVGKDRKVGKRRRTKPEPTRQKKITDDEW